MEKYISATIISFFIYAFAGWIWESFVYPVCSGHKIKNGGFLNGPIIPIYGVGAITVSLLFSPTETYLSIFIEGAFVACVIEYITSWGMEKLYHRRWWDYSDRAFHVNGRVCLEGFILFGVFSVACVKYIQPHLLARFMRHDMLLLVINATVLVTILCIDLAVTVCGLMHLEERLDEFVKDLEIYVQKAYDDMEENRHNFLDVLEQMKIQDHNSYIDIYKKRKFNEKRIVKAFPHLIDKKKK